MSSNPSSLQAFFAELKRRRVFRVMAVYGAVAFVVLQVADLAIGPLGLPEWTMTFILFFALAGFPIAIVLAWAFESTPDGMKRTAEAAPEEIQQIVAQPASRRWPAGLLALAGMILLFGGGWWMGQNRGSDAVNLLVSDAQAADFRALAVLPFENVNATEDNRMIAVGVHEDLLSQMSRIAALRVTSRTSVREYGDTDKSLREIADELGVEFIMEGSVRSSGSQVRVSVTLIDASTDEQIWNHQYDKEVTPDNLFQIQSEIARSVVDELEAKLTPQDVASLDAIEPASDLAAQSWYYRAVEEYERGVVGLDPSRDHLARAVEIDPNYVAAWSFLAKVESRREFIGQRGEQGARIAMDRTLELAPGSVDGFLATGFYEYYAQQDYDAALIAFQEAERLAPSNSGVAWALGLILRRQGKWDASTRMMKRAVQLDPRNTLRLETLHENLRQTGAYRDAGAIVERSLSIDPTNPKSRMYKVEALVDLDGNTRRAHRLASELGIDPTHPEESAALFKFAWIDRDYQRVLELVEQVDARGVNFIERNLLATRGIALERLGDPAAAAVGDSLLAGITPKTMFEAAVPTFRALGHRLAGRRAEALREAREADRLIRRMDDHVTKPGFAFAIAQTYGVLGELDAGFDLLDELVERPGDEFSVTSLGLSPAFDPYRGDPRFDEIIRRREAFEAEGARMGEAGRPWLP